MSLPRPPSAATGPQRQALTLHQRQAQTLHQRLALKWTRLSLSFLPFADVATTELPWPRLMRLALFQVSVGMAYALLVGTLNRVMIVELGVSAWAVSVMVALPLLVAPLRALVGHRSDTHLSALGWRRVPYLWFGTLLQFGGLSVMPFALILLQPGAEASAQPGGVLAGRLAAALAFVLVGAGMQTTQTAGLALATDQARPDTRPRVVAMMYVMLLLGMVAASVCFSVLLQSFSPTRLVAVVQGAALTTMVLNTIALWKQEARGSVPRAAAQGDGNGDADAARPTFRDVWRRFAAQPHTRRFLVAVALGTAAFNMQDIVLEPYGGAILHLPVAATSLLTAGMALGSVIAFALAARLLARGVDAHRLAALGLLIGIAAFSAVIFAAPLASGWLFRLGNLLIGLGGGLFAVSTLVVAMGLESSSGAGLALGAWGAMQATAGGLAVALGGTLRDGFEALAANGWLGPAMSEPQVAYSVVYHLEIALLFGTLIAIGPLVRRTAASPPSRQRMGLAEFPG
ncbi:BCD family MFS transporter [Roseateles terrae]|uniref:BCD family chlorophyll transporter-like MFS transporter n=1 Tax=Roseateles terrae TaxID=431060 RepID=A0ABR6GUK0_9BURK|nr:BCD family MFS transporter [Roseateles terrae]MBB3195745.1 BCD family chlorophyll transporter-like MFS transporter [Roseateles terrae]OWQ86636.1 MFS transporter [Roseateles terrae]